MHPIKVKRNPDGTLAEKCPINVGVLIGSFDCTANCPNNQNTKQEIQQQAFDLEFVKCTQVNKPNQIILEL